MTSRPRERRGLNSRVVLLGLKRGDWSPAISGSGQGDSEKLAGRTFISPPPTADSPVRWIRSQPTRGGDLQLICNFFPVCGGGRRDGGDVNWRVRVPVIGPLLCLCWQQRRQMVLIQDRVGFASLLFILKLIMLTLLWKNPSLWLHLML